MDVTCANVRREFATPRTLWVEVIGLGTTFLVITEAVRRLLAAGSGLPGLVGTALLLAAVGYGGSRFAAQAVRRASLDAELWRKFGLDQELLAAVAQVPAGSPATSVVDRALQALRSLAAVGNHEAWERLVPADDEGVAAAVEPLLTRLLSAPTLDEAALGRLVGQLEALADAQRSWLAEDLRGDEAAAAAAASDYHARLADLRRWPGATATEGAAAP